MKIYTPTSFGWKYNQRKNKAVIKKKSQIDFVLSVIIAFFIILIISQILSYLDQTIRDPLARKSFSLLNPLIVNSANASDDEAFKMIQSHREINIVKGRGFTFEVGFKNKTNYTWMRTGPKSVDLKLAPPYNRATPLRHKFWRDAETPAWLKNEQAKPGWLAYYKFALEAPKQPGIYKEKFVLVSYGDGHVLSGSEFEIVLNVWDSAEQFAKKQKRIITNKNASKNSQPKADSVTRSSRAVGLAEICLNIKPSDFEAAVDQRLLDECLKIGIKVTKEGASYINLDSTPASLPSPDLEPDPEPSTNPLHDSAPAPVASDGPIMRIGLFYTTEPVLITANSLYKVKDKSGDLLTTIPANIESQVVFNFSTKTYTLTTNGASLATSSYLRFESENQDNVFEIVSYENRPGWNSSLNDNKFLGNLEIRYASSTGRLWLINELPIETYLKGLAESSNSSPLEYQKALITAARTYAMHHYNRGTKHADEYFTLDARYDQVYKGYGSQIRLPKVVQAVEETKGQVVTYNGEIAITPYFSHSDGRTRDWEEVWGGSVAWCRSVKEPEGYDRTTLYGHGVGMSARGALILAADHNYNFKQILKYYYTGIELKKIY